MTSNDGRVESCLILSVRCSPLHCATITVNYVSSHRSFEDQNLTSLNTGAVEVFNLDFLSFRFDRLSYSVLEGDTLRYCRICKDTADHRLDRANQQCSIYPRSYDAPYHI